MPCIAKVAVNDATIHFDKLYSYLVPPDFSESLWPGSIVCWCRLGVAITHGWLLFWK